MQAADRTTLEPSTRTSVTSYQVRARGRSGVTWWTDRPAFVQARYDELVAERALVTAGTSRSNPDTLDQRIADLVALGATP